MVKFFANTSIATNVKFHGKLSMLSEAEYTYLSQLSIDKRLEGISTKLVRAKLKYMFPPKSLAP